MSNSNKYFDNGATFVMILIRSLWLFFIRGSKDHLVSIHTHKKDLHNGPFWDTKVMLFYCFDVTFSFQKIGVIGLCRLLTLSDPFFWYKARSYDRSVSPILEPSLLVIRIGHKNIASRWISWSRWVEVEIYFENIARLLCFSFIITNCMTDLQKTILV